jgi:YVTN family beta-propeller protein
MLALVLLAQLQSHPFPGQADTTRRGVIATAQSVTPAGVQTVFQGRVAGVRFGSRANELWVAVPGRAERLNWRENRLVSSINFGGRPGVNGIAIDATAQRVLIASIGRATPGAQTPSIPGTAIIDRNEMVRLASFAEDAVASSPAPSMSAPVFVADGLSDFMAASPAVAPRASEAGVRRAILTLPASDRVVVIDADRGTLLQTVAVGVLPVAAVISTDGTVAYVANFGGAKPTKGERAARECCGVRAELVRVDKRGVAAEGSVSRIELASGRVTATIRVGRHPGALAWDQSHGRLYVADGVDDAVSVIDTRTNLAAGTIGIHPFRERLTGLAPTALALSPDGATLYVALGGVNAVAVYDVSGGLRGLIPTGWYPSSLDVSADGSTLAVGTLLGIGSGEGSTDGSPGKRAGFVLAVRGSVNVIPVPDASTLAAYTTAVAANNKLTLSRGADTSSALAANGSALRPRAGVAARAVPQRPGEPSLIDHVVFIIKENRTYDQVLGDLTRGSSDSSLVVFGRDVTPNTHALAEQYVILDHFFASGGNSADGHQWLTQANETDYVMWPLYYGRSYPSEGNDPLAYSVGGFLWETTQAKGRTVSVFGEFAPAPSDSVAGVRRDFLARYRTEHTTAQSRTQLAARYRTRSEIPSLDRSLVREYPGWTMEVPDVVLADDFLDHLGDWEKSAAMPNLVMMVLPNDHTRGTSAGWCTPKACVADNDLALGKIVEGITHSTFWKSTAIFVVEDDAQNGVDHIDGHRTVALAISPYIRRGAVDSTFYVQPSMVKTIELILGLPALSIFDLTATDMRASFLDAGAMPDLTPYRALVPAQSIYETNLQVGAITGPHAAERRRAALASGRMNFSEPDAAPSEALNRILWHDVRGWGVPYPTVRHSLFFPMSVDLTDEEREERASPRTKRRLK